MISNKKKGVLLVNLGTPEKASKKSIRSFLSQMLSDPRVVDLNPILWGAILNLRILPFRPGKILGKYRSIMMKEGSPLLVHGRELTKKVQEKTGNDIIVRLAMRYGSHSIRDALEEMKRHKVNELIVLPLFPQYASATTGSAMEAIFNILKTWEYIPSVKTLNSFYDDSRFIECQAILGEDFLAQRSFDHVLFSYHGLVERYLRKLECDQTFCLADSNCCDSIGPKNEICYRAQCFQTSRMIAEKLSIPVEKYTVSFQSRFGPEKWLSPYTDDTIRDLAKKGVKRLLVFCPSFTMDCLETIEEIGMEEKENFLQLGGDVFELVPSLNSHDKWVESVVSMIDDLSVK